MKKSRLHIFSSIFLKLILIVIFFGALINLSVWIFLRFSSDFRPKKIIPTYIAKMNEYIVKDLGFPPDTLKAKELSEELNINIRFQSHTFNWTTSDYVPLLEELAVTDVFKDNFPYKEAFTMQYNKRPYHIYKTPKGVYILAPLTPQDFFYPERAILILVLLISIIFIPLYLILRWLFNPLRRLSTAVNEIGKGNYDIEIPVKRKDELGELAKSIKEMAVRIKQNMKAKEQLLIDVSHELRTPLTRIKLGLEVDSPKEKINEDVTEMEKMITGLIEDYRSDNLYEKLNLENTDVVKLLGDLITSPDFQQRIKLNTNTGGKILLNVDAVKFRTLFRNLIDNALKYSSDYVELSVADSSDSVAISVKDKGIGIAEEDLNYIFEPFYRADRSRSRKTGGYGLGLAICKKIVEAHGGNISINSKLNEGTEVTVRFNK